jgi:hypothetical protein
VVEGAVVELAVLFESLEVLWESCFGDPPLVLILISFLLSLPSSLVEQRRQSSTEIKWFSFIYGAINDFVNKATQQAQQSNSAKGCSVLCLLFLRFQRCKIC